jgi:Cu(I)/Ag(I) efflux system membrane fusion protein
VRIELPNRSGKLRAGLYAQVTLRGPAEPVLVVPSEAVIRTGQRAVVFVAGTEPGQFAPVEVRLGARWATSSSCCRGCRPASRWWRRASS